MIIYCGWDVVSVGVLREICFWRVGWGLFWWIGMFVGFCIIFGW